MGEINPSGGEVGLASYCTALLVILSLLPTLFPEQARAAAGQLLRWKQDEDQDGYLLLKSVFVLTGTDLVSSRPNWPWPGHSSSCAWGGPSTCQVCLSFHEIDISFLPPHSPSDIEHGLWGLKFWFECRLFS